LHKVALLRCFSFHTQMSFIFNCIQTFLSLLRVCSTCNLIKRREKKNNIYLWKM
jgi:hypothetical protein